MLKQILAFLIPLLLAAPGAFSQRSLPDRLVDRVLTLKEFKDQQKVHIALNDSLDKEGDYKLEYYYLDTLLHRSRKLHNRKMEGAALISLGNFYLGTGNNFASIEAFRDVIGSFDPIKDYKLLINAYTNMGNTYFYMGDLDKALDSYKNAITLHKRSPQDVDADARLANIYNNMGGVYCTKKDFVFGRSYLDLAMSMWTKLGDSLSIGYCYNNFANIYLTTKKYDSAIYYFNKALPLKMKFGDRTDKADAYDAIGSYYLEVKRPKEALDCFRKAFAFLDTLVPNRNLVACYLGFQTSYHQLKDCSNELKYFKLYKATGESANDKDQQANITRREMQFEFSKVHLADSIKAVQEIRLKDVKLSEKKKESYFLVFALLLTFVALSLIWSRFRLTQKQKKVIEEQKMTVDIKNKEIIESITYAKRLQEAILPPLNHVKEILSESFVIYQPKDIVAGDFYWMHISSELRDESSENNLKNSELRTKSSELIFIAAADCTGHGVPGAMVSVVCSNALNRAVKEFGITEPGKILDKVRELVIETFEKSENDVKDGMDISLLVIDPSNRVAKWSGAHNRLLYMEQQELHELKADRQPIGKSDHPQPFTTHVIPLTEGMIFYLFTDGIVDQFGGPGAKKMTIGNFKKLLQSLSGMEVTAQRQAILDHLVNWKKDLEQIDDITVIGIRL